MKLTAKMEKFAARVGSVALVLLALAAIMSLSMGTGWAQENWTHYMRTSGHGLNMSHIDSIIARAKESHEFGIEVDNDITGRYATFMHPAAKLAAIRAMAEKAHAAGNHAFVYIAAFECITSRADSVKHNLYGDHPDWVQRNFKGQPAVFGHGIAFWVSKGDQDAWLTPYAPGWRKIYMKRVRQIAATGIDGIYVDIPYWMTFYPGWENSWGSFDKYTVAAFKKETGLNAMDMKLGDFNDPTFVQWVKFRMRTITDFLEQVKQNIKSVNPQCELIPEIYPGLGSDPVTVGADPYQLAPVADVITHEYHVGKVYAAERRPFNWYNFITGIKTFTAFAYPKPTWILSYSWYKDKHVKPSAAMKSLFASELFSGANVWDAKGFVMSSSNNLSTRKIAFKWIEKNQYNLYGSRRYDVDPVGIYFSPDTRDLFPYTYINSYRGMMLLLMNNHVDFQIVTPRTLHAFKGKLLILDNIKCVDNREIQSFRSLLRRGTKFLVTGNSLSYDDNRVLRLGDYLKTLFGVEDTSNDLKKGEVLYMTGDPGMTYYTLADSMMDGYFNGNQNDGNKLKKYCGLFGEKLSAFCDTAPAVRVHAPLRVISFVSDTRSKTYINLMDVRQLSTVSKGPENPDRITISYKKTLGGPWVRVTPFLGDTCIIQAESKGGDYSFQLPNFSRGAVVWLDKD